MKKLVILWLFAIMASGFQNLFAQECQAYFPSRKGAVREMKSYDKKDKFTGSVRQKIVDFETNANGFSMIVDSEIYDEKGEMVSVNDLKMSCENDIFTIDMKNFVDQNIWEGMQGMEIKINASNLEFPAGLSVGQELKDGSIEVQALNMGIPMMRMNIKITDRKVEAREEITTPAGTFTCFRITYITEMQSFGKYTAKGIDWYAEDVGAVRTESYDRNAKLVSYSILSYLEN